MNERELDNKIETRLNNLHKKTFIQFLKKIFKNMKILQRFIYIFLFNIIMIPGYYNNQHIICLLSLKRAAHMTLIKIIIIFLSQATRNALHEDKSLYPIPAFQTLLSGRRLPSSTNHKNFLAKLGSFCQLARVIEIY